MNGNLVGYRVKRFRLFSLRRLKILFHCLLVDAKSKDHCFIVGLFLSLVLLRFFYHWCLIVMCLVVTLSLVNNETEWTCLVFLHSWKHQKLVLSIFTFSFPPFSSLIFTVFSFPVSLYVCYNPGTTLGSFTKPLLRYI